MVAPKFIYDTPETILSFGDYMDWKEYDEFTPSEQCKIMEFFGYEAEVVGSGFVGWIDGDLIDEREKWVSNGYNEGLEDELQLDEFELAYFEAVLASLSIIRFFFC